MRITLTLITFYIALVFFGNSKSYAQNPQVHTAPKPSWLSTYKPYDKKPKERDIQDGYYYALSEKQINAEKQCEYRHYVREMVSSAGIQDASQITVDFNPAYERVDFHEIIVWRNNKPQNRLNIADFKVLADEQEFSKFIYDGTYSANLILSDIRRGDRIEYSYSITGRNPIFNNRFAKDIYLEGGQIIEHQYIALFASPTHKLNMKFFNQAVKPVISDAAGLKKYEWEDFQIKPVSEDNNQPSWYNQYKYVQVSDYNSWAEVADWATKINMPTTDIKGNLGELIAQLKQKSGNDKVAYFRSAVKIVQDEVRYMGIEIGEYSNRANRPEKVYDQLYGDCKDKSLLLVSMLRANGIEAYMVLVNSDIEGRIDQFIPSPNIFDHAVVVATVNGKQVWVDATISYQRGAGTNIYFPDYGKGLVLKPGNSGLTTISQTETGKITCVEKYTITKENERVKLDVKTIYTLNQADDIRASLASDGLAQTEKNYLDYYAKTYSKVETRDSLQVTDDEQKNQLTTDESYWIKDFYKPDSTSGRSSAEFYADYISRKLPQITGKTNTPVAVAFPYDMDYTVKIVNTAGWDITAKHNAIKRNAYSFESDYSSSVDTLSLRYRFAYLKDYIPVDKLGEFKRDISTLKDDALAYSISQPTLNPSFRLNVGLVVFALVIAIAVIFFGIWIYRTETPGIVFAKGASFIPLGGWLLLVTLGLSLSPIAITASMVNNNYFSISKWNTYAYATGNYSLLFKSVLVFETFGNTVLIGYAIFCLILILNKRDILPKMITGFYGFAVVFFLVDYMLALNLGEAAAQSALTALLRGIVVAAIWIPYFRVSTRVAETFIVPHPADNYSYEE